MADVPNGQASGEEPPADPLTVRLLDGDQQVLKELLSSEGPRMEKWLKGRYHGLRPLEREDVIWEAVARLWEKRFTLSPKESLRACLWTHLRNVVVDRLRAPWHRQQVAEQCLDPGPLAALAVGDASKADPAEDTEESARTLRLHVVLHEALDHLSSIERALLWDRACTRPGYEPAAAESARKYGISESAVGTHLWRAKKKLIQILPLLAGGGSPRGGWSVPPHGKEKRAGDMSSDV